MSFFKNGDVIEIPSTTNSVWAGLGVVVEPDGGGHNASVLVVMLTGGRKGDRGGFHIGGVSRVHGRVAITARETVPVPAPMRIYQI